MSDYRIETKCVQAGYTPGNGEPRQIPIIQSTTFKYATSEDMGKLFDLEASRYFYSRLQNPTCDHVAAKIAALEGGSAAMLTGSGQAANFMALFNICEAGSHIVASSSIYGGTFNLIAVTLKKMGIDSTFVSPDATDDELDRAFRPNTRAMFGETIANPALTVLDIEKFAQAAHRHGVPLIVDNTFPTPVNCQPIRWGADIVTHSTTKYMDGHGAALGGVIVDSGNFDWMTHAEKYPGALHARRKLPRHHLRREIRQCGGIHHQMHQPADARFGLRAVPAECVHPQSGVGESACADAAPLRERDGGRAVPRKTAAGGVRQLSAPAVQPVLRPRDEVHAERRLRGGVVRLEGRTSRGGGVHEAVDFGGD